MVSIKIVIIGNAPINTYHSLQEHKPGGPMPIRTLHVLIVVATACVVAVAAPSSCKTRSVVGSVQANKTGSSDWKPLRVGMKVDAKDLVRTLAESQAEIEFPSGGNVTIGENSLVDFKELLTDGQVNHTKVDLKSGRLLFKVHKLNQASTFQFQMGNATAAIRGTEGGIVHEDGNFGAFLLEGRLDFELPGGKQSIGAGEALFAPAGQAPVHIDFNKILEQLRSAQDSAALRNLAERLRAEALAGLATGSPAWTTVNRIFDAFLPLLLRNLAQKRNEDKYRLELSTPGPLSVCDGAATIAGKWAAPAGSALFVNIGGQNSPDLLSTATDSTFSYTFAISDRAGNWNAQTAEAILRTATGDVMRSVVLNIDKTCPAINLLAPVLSVDMSDSSGCRYKLGVTGVKDDQVVLRSLVDGMVMVEERLTDDKVKEPRKLEVGVHTYAFEATDLAGNTSRMETAPVACWRPLPVDVRIEGPVREILKIPPPPPGMAAADPVRIMRFRLTLPNGYDHRYLRRIVVKVRNGNTLMRREGVDLTDDSQYAVEIPLKTGMQTIDVEVEPQVGKIRTFSKTYEVRR